MTAQNPNVEPNMTGEMMIAQLRVLDETLAFQGLTIDATRALESRRDVLNDQFKLAAGFAGFLASTTGTEFTNSLGNVDLRTEIDVESKVEGSAIWDDVDDCIRSDSQDWVKPEELIGDWSKLSPEQFAEANRAITTLAREYDREISDFGLIETKKRDDLGNETDILKVILTSTAGVDLVFRDSAHILGRDWHSTISEIEKFNLSSLTMNDARALALANPEIGEMAWLTGERNIANAGKAPLVDIRNGDVSCTLYAYGNTFYGVFFRPAVEIK